MKLPKIRELIEAIKALSHRPYTSAFPAVPHEPFSQFRGQPKFDADQCVGCLSCEFVCPAEAISHRDITENGTPVREMIHYTDTCIFCGSCETGCIAEQRGIQLSNDWELSFFDRTNEGSETITKDLQLCELCGEAIACTDHLLWISERLGELSYSNPTLYQTRLKELGIIDQNIASAIQDYSRADRVKILCARCRKETTLTTE